MFTTFQILTCGYWFRLTTLPGAKVKNFKGWIFRVYWVTQLLKKLNAFKGIAQTVYYNNKTTKVTSESRSYNLLFPCGLFKSNKYSSNEMSVRISILLVFIHQRQAPTRKPSSWIHICRKPNQGSVCFSGISLLSAETGNSAVSKNPHLFDTLIRSPLFVLEVRLLKQVQLLVDVALCSGLFLALMWYFQETISRWYTRWQFNHISLSYWANLVYSLFFLSC